MEEREAGCKGRHTPEGRAVPSITEPVNSVEQSLRGANSRTASQQFPTNCETMKFITPIGKAHHRLYPEPNGFTASHGISLRVIVMLTFQPSPVLLRGF
jgi:hypothetical protein